MISELLSLARTKATILGKNNLFQIIKTMAPLIKANALNQDKVVELELESGSLVLVNEKEFRQLILNRVNNGLESMTPGGD